MISPKTVLTILFILCLNAVGFSQTNLTWDDLADVTFETKFDEEYEYYYLAPIIGKQIRRYEGKEVLIKGYFLDLSGSGEILLLSKNPMAQCFFCGGAGPETIIEVNFKEKPSFKTDNIVLITGVLEINTDDIDQCNFILNDATGQLVK